MTQASARITAKDLTYGIEIECGITPTSTLRVGGRRAGLATTELPMFCGQPWKAEHDGSVSVGNLQPVEFVSPVLQGASGLDNIREVCTKIARMGGKVNETCGLHVHVAFPTDSIDAMRRLTRLFSRVEAGIFASTGTPARRANFYCKPIKESAKSIRWAGLSIASESQKNDVRYSRNSLLSDRYHALNFQNLLTSRQNTVEFRAFSGSLSPRKIAAWIKICLTLVEMALDGKDAGFEVSARTMNFTPQGVAPQTTGEHAAGYLTYFLWKAPQKTKVKYGELDHPEYTTKDAIKVIEILATRHDIRAGLRPAGHAVATPLPDGE